MPAKAKMNIEPHPDKILVRISKASWDELFFKKIVRHDGSEVELMTRVEEKEGFDGKFAQNVSVGMIVAVGKNVKNVYLSDIAILDYLVSNNNDVTVGFFNGDKLISLPAVTTYHSFSSKRSINGRRAFMKGDFDVLSPLLGVVRKKEIIAFDPYVVVEHKSNLIAIVDARGKIKEEIDPIAKRKVIAADPSSGYKDGDRVIIKDEDLFFRSIENKEISLTIGREILAKKVDIEEAALHT